MAKVFLAFLVATKVFASNEIIEEEFSPFGVTIKIEQSKDSVAISIAQKNIKDAKVTPYLNGGVGGFKNEDDVKRLTTNLMQNVRAIKESIQNGQTSTGNKLWTKEVLKDTLARAIDDEISNFRSQNKPLEVTYIGPGKEAVTKTKSASKNQAGSKSETDIEADTSRPIFAKGRPVMNSCQKTESKDGCDSEEIQEVISDFMSEYLGARCPSGAYMSIDNPKFLSWREAELLKVGNKIKRVKKYSRKSVEAALKDYKKTCKCTSVGSNLSPEEFVDTLIKNVDNDLAAIVSKIKIGNFVLKIRDDIGHGLVDAANCELLLKNMSKYPNTHDHLGEDDAGEKYAVFHFYTTEEEYQKARAEREKEYSSPRESERQNQNTRAVE